MFASLVLFVFVFFASLFVCNACLFLCSCFFGGYVLLGLFVCVLFECVLRCVCVLFVVCAVLFVS